MIEKSIFSNRIELAFARTFGATFAALTLLVTVWSVVSIA